MRITYPDAIDVGEGDLAIIRRLAVEWLPIESGTPGTVPDPNLGTDEEFRHAVLAAEILLELGELPVGRYEYDSPLDSNRLDDEPFIASGRVERHGSRIVLNLLPEHLVLLRATNTSFLDGGGRDIGLCIDGKRPYGDMTAFELDMAPLLGMVPADDGDLSDAQRDELDGLHEMMQPVMQVFLIRATLAPGSFAREPHGRRPWRRTSP